MECRPEKCPGRGCSSYRRKNTSSPTVVYWNHHRDHTRKGWSCEKSHRSPHSKNSSKSPRKPLKRPIHTLVLLKELTALDPENEKKVSSLIGEDTGPQVANEVLHTMSPRIPDADFDPQDLFQTPGRASYTPSETRFLQDAADRLMKGIHKARGKDPDPGSVDGHSSARGEFRCRM